MMDKFQSYIESFGVLGDLILFICLIGLVGIWILGVSLSYCILYENQRRKKSSPQEKDSGKKKELKSFREENHFERYNAEGRLSSRLSLQGVLGMVGFHIIMFLVSLFVVLI